MQESGPQSFSPKELARAAQQKGDPRAGEVLKRLEKEESSEKFDPKATVDINLDDPGMQELLKGRPEQSVPTQKEYPKAEVKTFKQEEPKGKSKQEAKVLRLEDMYEEAVKAGDTESAKKIKAVLESKPQETKFDPSATVDAEQLSEAVKAAKEPKKKGWLSRIFRGK